MTVQPLIDGGTVRQNALGRPAQEIDPFGRVHGGVKAVVEAVYPIGHPKNPSEQTLVDVRPTVGLPLLFGVPVCLGHAHQETAKEVARTSKRLPYDPKARNRVEGSSSDVRPGTFVWVQFHGGDLREPVVVSTMGFAEQSIGRQRVDRLDDDGDLAVLEVDPLQSTIEKDKEDPKKRSSSFPRQVQVYNGCRVEIDNRGNITIHTSTDHAAVFPGHNDIPAAPTPQGNYLVSARGARVGDIGFATGKLPGRDDAAPRGRQFRTTTGAKDGSIHDSAVKAEVGRLTRHTEDCKDGSIHDSTEKGVGSITRRTVDCKNGNIRDETSSEKGSWIARLKKGVGRFFVSTRGADNGSVYLENAKRHYLALTDDGAEVHGSKVILDGDDVYLGSGEVGDNVVLHSQLDQLMQQLWTAIDTHMHTGVESGESVTGPPEVPTFTLQWSAGAENCKAANVFVDQSNSSSPSKQDDPGDD